MSCASPSGTLNSHASPSTTCTLVQPFWRTFSLAWQTDRTHSRSGTQLLCVHHLRTLVVPTVDADAALYVHQDGKMTVDMNHFVLMSCSSCWWC